MRFRYLCHSGPHSDEHVSCAPQKLYAVPGASASIREYERYHDTEWGVPVRDDRMHFEFLVLEGAQAGLSWWTILRKREGYRARSRTSTPRRSRASTRARVERLLNDASIVRNRQKIEAAIANARGFLDVQKEFGSFDTYVWRFVGGKPIVNRWRKQREVPATTQGVRRAEQGSQSARLQVRGLDDHLRAHAGHRARQRSPRRLLPLRRERPGASQAEDLTAPSP